MLNHHAGDHLMKLEHGALDVHAELKDEILQRDVEKIFANQRELGMDVSVPQYHGNLIRACKEAGVLECGDVAEMKPAAVRWLAQRLDEELAALFDIPPE